MNNSNVQLEEKEDSRLSFLQKQLGELAQIVEAINRVEASEDWQKLKKLLFDDTVKNIERQSQLEVNKSKVDLPAIYRLQGQLVWAKKYSDLRKLSEAFRQQIENLKNQINEKNPRDGAL